MLKHLRFPCLTIVILAGFLPSGCGLNEYQRTMDEQRARIRKFDERNRQLDDPIEIPVYTRGKVKEEAPAWPFDFILRLPKGYGTLPKEKTNYYLDFPCFRYAGGMEGARSAFVAAALVGEPGGTEPGKYALDIFRQNVQHALSDYLRKNRKGLLDPGDGKYTPYRYRQFSAYPDSAPILAFDWTEYRNTFSTQANEHTVFDVYIHADGDKQVAVVVHRDLQTPNLETINAAFQTSLGSLDVNGDIAKRRAAFRKRR